MTEPEKKSNTVGVRQGVAPGVVRYVLLWSLVLAVAGLVAAFVFS